MNDEDKFIGCMFLFILTVIGVLIAFFINNILFGIVFTVLALIFTMLGTHYQNKTPTVTWNDINKKVDLIEEKIDRLGD